MRARNFNVQRGLMQDDPETLTGLRTATLPRSHESVHADDAIPLPLADNQGGQPPMAAEVAGEHGEPSDLPSRRIRFGVALLGPTLLFDQPMVSLFEFVRRLRSSMGHRWPDISDEFACAILKARLHHWSSDLLLQAPQSPCHATTGWIRPRRQRRELRESFIG